MKAMRGKRKLGPALLLFATVVAAGGEKPEIVERAGWNALEARPYTGQEPVRFTIHHSAVQPEPDTDFAKHLKNTQTWGMGEAREWADIPYHFIIDPKGTIYEGRDPGTAGESNTDYAIEGHLQVNLMGNFEEHPVPEEQFEALVALLAWSGREFGIPPETIRAHRDLAPTVCPGEHLYDSIESGALREAVKEALAGAEEL